MTTELQEASVPASPDNNKEPTIPSDPEHEYHFEEGAEITLRYQVIAPLGFGGFSEVYHCQDKRLERDVAVKVLTKKGLGLKEARKAAKLEHPQIVQVYDVTESDDGMSLIVFRYLEGETLEEHLDRAQYRRLPLDKGSLNIIRQVSDALDYAHAQGVIHQDIKPSNIILDSQKNAYLTDFGLAEVKSADNDSVLSAEISGTIPYMAPEKFTEGKLGDEASDLYSLGVVVYEMLTGQLPYRGRGPSLIFQIGTGDPFPPTLANPDLPQGLEQVLLQALDKKPEKRHRSCLAFVKELEEAAQAYVEASAQYSKAREFVTARRWREALAAFEALEGQAPGFKDTAHYTEQARHQVRLLELYEQAEEALKERRYQDALSTLNTLTQLAPDYDVADFRQRAREGLAQEEKRGLDEQYQQAVQQFENGEYQECLDTLAVIRERDPNYPDPKGIEGPARERAERQRYLRDLYIQGTEQMGQEEWGEAIATFEKVQREAPGYEDVETRLAMARHMDRMSSLLQEARTLLEQDAFTASRSRLDELRRIDADYKRDEVARLHEGVLNRLYGRAKHLMEQREFEESLASLAELRKLSPDYAGLDELEGQAREGIRVRDLRARLDDLYKHAMEHLSREDYTQAFESWQAIQQQQGDLEYPDELDVKGRIRQGLYSQAQVALAQKDPDRSLDLWRQVREVDPPYPDNQQVEEQARAMIKGRERTRLWALRIGGGAIGLLLLSILVVAITRGCGGAVVPPTATPTWTPSPSPTIIVTAVTPTATATGSPSPTPTVVTPTPTLSPTPTTTTNALEIHPQGSSIFAKPSSDSRVLGGVSEGEWVVVLGRSAYGEWFYIRNDQGVEGFVYKPRFEWTGDYDSLPIVVSDATPAPVTPPTGPPYASLEMDLWDIGEGWCSEGYWYKRIYIQGHGGNGVYTYYWDGTRMAGPTGESHAFEMQSMGGGAVIGTGKVVSGDGQAVERELYIRVPDCAR